ncbi:MAG TPA: hypothetical protein VK806_14105, partial [Bacteroidia bacterium]|nr:hypothetical protein [Bacteroidia bacterium]
LLTFLHLLQHKHPLTFQSKGCKIFFALLLAYCMYYAGYRTRIRYSTDDLYVKYSFLHNRFEFADLTRWNNDYAAHFKALETISPYLKSIGISSTDLVLSLPDVSNNNSLYFMDHKGFTGFNYSINDSNTIKLIIKTGAKYLILNDTTFLPQTAIAPFINKQIGRYRNVNIYSLKEI